MSQPALASDQAPPRSVHRLVSINYIPRVVGYALFGVIFYTMFAGSDNLLLWAGLIWHSLLWPHAAYWHGRLSKDPVRAEFRNYAIEAFVGGTWMAISSFSLWPCCTVLVAGFANNIATGGFRLLAKNVLFAGAGAFTMAWILDFPFEPDSRLLTAYSSIVFLLVYMALVARQAYMNAKRLFRSSKALDTANEEIREKFDAAQREITERKRVEKELLRVNDDLQRFAYSVSHDLKAPLRGMAGLIHFIEEDLSEESRKRAKPNLEVLGGRMLRLEKLITGILEYTQVDREQTHQPVAVKKVLEEVLLDLNIPPHITVEIASDMPTI
ncbi:MAG: MASE2 domain-containing protein, partial [Bacteroidota bacterium]